MKESKFQAELVKEIKQMYPDCFVMKTDPNDTQGISDLLILKDDKWAMLECKKSKDAPHRVNQDYYVEKFNNMSFASFIFPENRKEVLDELEQAFRTRRSSRIPRSK